MAEISLQAVNTYGSNMNNNRPITFQANQEAKAAANSPLESMSKKLEESAKVNTDTAEITEPQTNKSKYESTAEVLKKMREAVASLGNSDVDRNAVGDALKKYQEELSGFVSGYNDALNFAKQSTVNGLMGSAANMTTRSANYGEMLKTAGIGINDDNSLKTIENYNASKEPAHKAIKSHFQGTFSFGGKTLKDVQNILGN
jgi:hypothetical protein